MRVTFHPPAGIARAPRLLLCFLLPWLLSACGGGESAAPEAASTSAPAAAPAAEEKTSAILVKRDKDLVALFQTAPEKFRVELVQDDGGKRILRGVERKNGRRVYKVQGGDHLFDVRPNKVGFRVHDQAGELRWKANLSDDKIVLRTANDGAQYVLKTDGETTHLRSGSDYLGRIKHDAERGLGLVRTRDNATVLRATIKAPAAGIALFLAEDLSADERAVLIAELLARGR